MVLTVILTAFTLVILVRSGDLPYHIGVLIGSFILPAFSILGLFERKIIMICDTRINKQTINFLKRSRTKLINRNECDVNFIIQLLQSGLGIDMN